MESTQWRSWFGRTNIFPWPCLIGLYSTRMSNKQTKVLWTIIEICLNLKICSGAAENLLSCEKFGDNISSWSYDVEGHAKNAWNDIANWRTEQLNSYTKCRHIHLTRDFFSAISSLCTHHIVAQGVARRVCIKTCSSTYHHVFERLLFPCFVFLLCLSCLILFFSLLPVLCPELHSPCGRERRALNPMRARKMRSIPLWRYTNLSHKVASHAWRPSI